MRTQRFVNTQIATVAGIGARDGIDSANHDGLHVPFEIQAKELDP